MSQYWMRATLTAVLLAPLLGIAQSPAPPAAGAGTSAPAPAAVSPQAEPSVQPAVPAPDEPERGRRGRRTSVTIQMSEQDAERLREAIQDPELKAKIEEHIDRIGGQIDPREWRGTAALALMIPLSGIALTALIAWLIYRGVQGRIRTRMDMHTALLAKFGTGAEFTAFLASPGGKEYIEGLSGGPGYHLHVQGHLGRSAWIGYVFTAMGSGMLLVRLIQGGSLMGAVIMLAIGIGHLLAMRAARQQEERLGPPTLPGGTGHTGSHGE